MGHTYRNSQQAEFVKPLPEIYKSLNPGIEVGRDFIRATKSDKEENRQFFIRVFKDIINFFETAYALKDRMKFEQSQFNSLIIGADFPEIPKAFNSVCSKRGSIIHDSSIDFDISSQNDLRFGNEKIVTYCENGLRAAEVWVDQCYGIMARELSKIHP